MIRFDFLPEREHSEAPQVRHRFSVPEQPNEPSKNPLEFFELGDIKKRLRPTVNP